MTRPTRRSRICAWRACSWSKKAGRALKQVSGNFPAQFAALVADRKGDILMLLDKRKEAAAAYTDAYKAFDAESPYRRLVEVKLQALGAAPEAKAANAASAPSPATKEERS